MTMTTQGVDLLAFLRSRRSVRKFRSDPIPGETLEQILESAIWAPSAHNRQPWRFVVLTGLGSRARLADCMGAAFRRDLIKDGIARELVERQVERSRNRIQEAPGVVLLCLDPEVMDPYPDARRQRAEEVMAIQSVALAGGNLLLAAHAVGLAGVWVCAPLFAPEAVRTALDLPDSWIPQGMILLGFPAEYPPARLRRPLAEVVRYVA